VNFRIDLPTKLALVLLLWICAFAVSWEAQVVLILLIIMSRFAVPDFKPQSRRSAKAFTRFLIYSFAVATFVLILNSLLIRGGSTFGSIGGFSLYQDGLFFGIRTASRLLLLTFAILVFFISTPLKDLIRYLQARGLSNSFALILLLTLHFLDQLPARIHQIFLAQQARGAPVDAGFISRSRALFSILSPLVLSSIVESIDRGTALELRGFLHRPTSTEESQSSPGQRNVLTLLILFLSLIVVLYTIAQWLLG
jgi:energy-coupling factor transport system permease protein